MRTTLPRLRPVSAASAVGRRDVVQVDGGLRDRLVVAGVGELDQVGEVLGAVGAGGRGDRVAGAAGQPHRPGRRGHTPGQVEVDLVDGPEITEVLGQTGGLIEALCLPSHLDLRPVGFDEVWHRR